MYLIKKLFLFNVLFLLVPVVYSADSIDPLDYIFWDNGDEIRNGTYRAAPANQQELTSQRWTLVTNSALYSSDDAKNGNMSINLHAEGVTWRLKFDLGSELCDVTVQTTFFDDSADTTAGSWIDLDDEAGANIMEYGVQTGVTSTNYFYYGGSNTDSGVARRDTGINFTLHIDPTCAYAAFYIDGDLATNDTSIPGGIRFIRITTNADANNLDAQLDDVLIWEGNQNNQPQTAAPSDSCTYSSGDWNIDASDDCTISTVVDVLGNDVDVVGDGQVTITSTGKIDNFNIFSIHGTAIIACRNTGGCFG